jgi:hypothetical protein
LICFVENTSNTRETAEKLAQYSPITPNKAYEATRNSDVISGNVRSEFDAFLKQVSA